MDVSIIYVNYHTSSLIADSIKSVIRHVTDINYEFIIVDNNSEKNIENILSPFIPVDLSVKYIYNNENIGFGPANNIGAQYASGTYLFFLNPDTLLLNNAIKILSDFLNGHPDVGGCGGNLMDINNSHAYSFYKYFPGIRWELEAFTHYIFSHPFNSRNRCCNFSDSPIPVAYISGADLMVRKDIFQEVKGFPSDLFMYWDDVELCKRIKDIGYKIYNVPDARICHLESRSFDNMNLSNTLKYELQEKYRQIYLKRNIGTFQTKIADIIYWLILTTRVLGTKGKKKEYYKIRKQSFMKYR